MAKVKAADIKKKASKAAKKTADFAQSNPKELLIFAALLVGGYLIYKTVKGINSIERPKETPAPEVKEDNQLPPANINESQANTIAASLYALLRQLTPQDNKVLQLLENEQLNHNGFALVSKKFGKKQYNVVTGTSDGIFSPSLNLIQWLLEELNTPQQKAELKRILPTHF